MTAMFREYQKAFCKYLSFLI